jgi:hypothetical protein
LIHEEPAGGAGTVSLIGIERVKYGELVDGEGVKTEEESRASNG